MIGPHKRLEKSGAIIMLLLAGAAIAFWVGFALFLASRA